jgi:hypothetical protein
VDEYQRHEAAQPDPDEVGPSQIEALEDLTNDIADMARGVLAGVATTAVTVAELRRREKLLRECVARLYRELGMRP